MVRKTKFGANYMKIRLLFLTVLLFTTFFCYAQPANNDCANAEIINVTTATTTLVTFNNGTATESLQSSCENASNTYLDVWYEFTMPVNGNIQITGVNFADGFALYNTCGGAEITCFYDDGFIYNLSIGTYKLRASSLDTQAGSDSFSIQAFETPTNDECATPIVITDDITTQRSFSYDNRGATESLDASCDTASSTYLDIWYEFTMPVNGNFRITGVNIFDRFTLYDSCGGTEIICDADDSFAYNLSMGTYLLRVSKQSIYASADNFNIQAFATVANDECATAEVITDDISSERIIAYDNRGATESLDASCDTATNTHLDVWYEFTMPVNGNLRISGVNIFDRFTLYDSCGGTEISCFSGEGYVYNLITGTYTLRANKQSIYASADSFRIQAFATVANDECATAEVITEDITTQRTINFDNRNATESLDASCDTAGNDYLDVWYEFTMPVNGNLQITGTGSLDRFTLYDSCGGSEIHCDAANFFAYNLSTGTYYLRAYSQSIYASADSFNIQAFATAANDECATAELITDDISTQRIISYDNRAATESLDASCDSASNTYLDVWYEFTMPFQGNVQITGVGSLDRFTFYDACNGNEISCFSNDGFAFGLSTGNYFLRVSSQSIYASADSFRIQAYEALPNDGCANAEMISVAGVGECSSQNITVDTRRASETFAPNIGDCFSTSQVWLDAWYVFEAPITGNINLTSTNSNNTFAVYTACDGAEVACFANDGVIPVTFGNTYYIQAARSTNFANELTFCLEGAPDVAQGMVGICENIPSVEISNTQANTNEWVPILDAAGDIVAAINANGNDLGTVTTTLFIENADTRDFSGQPYLRREVSISASNAPSSSVSVRLYLLGDEVDDLMLADSNLTAISDLELMRVNGSTCTTGYTSGGDFITTSSSSYLDDYYIQFSTNSFSVFYPTSTNLDTTLSVPSVATTELGITIAPTVTDGIIEIRTENTLTDVTVNVFDITGRNIYQAAFETLHQNPQSIDLKGYQSGIYFMKISHQQKQITKRIILK